MWLQNSPTSQPQRFGSLSVFHGLAKPSPPVDPGVVIFPEELLIDPQSNTLAWLQTREGDNPWPMTNCKPILRHGS